MLGHTPQCVLQALVLVSFVGGGTAVRAQIGGVTSGLLYDAPGRSIRPLLGTPGAARVGPPLVTDLDQAFLSRDGRRVLVSAGGRGSVLDLMAGRVTGQVEVPAASGALRAAVWNANGTALAFLPADGPWHVWRPGRDTEPLLDLPAGRVAGSALDEAGTTLVVGLAGDEPGYYQLGPGVPPRLLLQSASPGPLLLADGERDLILIDQEGRRILRLPRFRDGGPPDTVAASGLGIREAVGLALSQSGTRLFVADRERQQVLVLDLLDHQAPVALDLDVPPSSLEPLAGSPLTLIGSGDTAGGTRYILVTAPPAVYFVPTAVEEQP